MNRKSGTLKGANKQQNPAPPFPMNFVFCLEPQLCDRKIKKKRFQRRINILPLRNVFYDEQIYPR